MKRTAIQIAVDADGNLYALADDGTIWTQGTRGWDKVEDLPQDPEEMFGETEPPPPARFQEPKVDPELVALVEEMAPGLEFKTTERGWLPNGYPIWCVDLNDMSVVRVPNDEVFARWSKHGNASWFLVEAHDEAAALEGALRPKMTVRETIIFGGQSYDVRSNIIPF